MNLMKMSGDLDGSYIGLKNTLQSGAEFCVYGIALGHGLGFRNYVHTLYLMHLLNAS